eukprot:10931365-Alexandrium_andersonii.AAC.1
MHPAEHVRAPAGEELVLPEVLAAGALAMVLTGHWRAAGALCNTHTGAHIVRRQGRHWCCSAVFVMTVLRRRGPYRGQH